LFFFASHIPEHVPIQRDADEWSSWGGRGDPVLQIELGKWADLMLVAPQDANTLAKMVYGSCDNLQLCTARAFDFENPLFLPRTTVVHHPCTGPQIDTLRSWGFKEIPCVTTTLMCGDTGLGAMAKVESIVQQVAGCLRRWRFISLVSLQSRRQIHFS
ncbi:phosphopantothenoylcysteine decarboxylase-like, partial [Armigeres subalbatus]|uniref:phosphopantothenoylcysteine decarboxylase-like n=1 Tax=Armigeres subalbatus TaxID=124917 RepID=UPI002ED6ADE8